MKNIMENTKFPFMEDAIQEEIGDHNLKFIEEGLSFPKNGNIFDEVMGTPAAGDFLLAEKDIFMYMTSSRRV